MAMKKAAVVLTVIFALLLATTAFAGPSIDKILKKNELAIGTSGDYPPFNMKTKDGALAGYDIDLGMIIASGMGVKVRFVQIPFDQLLDALNKGKVDMVISAMTITSKRNLKNAFVGPYFISGQSMVTTKETALKAEQLSDIDKPDFTLAVPKGTTSEIAAKTNLKQTNITVTKDMNEAVQLLLSGKVKAVFTDTVTGFITALRHQDKGLVSTSQLTYEPFGVAIPGNDPLFVNYIENVLGTLRGNGTLDIMIEKWFKDSSWLVDLP